MNNLINLYSQYNYSDKEIKQNRVREVIAIIVAIVVHVLLILLFGGSFFEIPKPKEEIKVINVRLLESTKQPTTMTTKKTVKNTEKVSTKTKTTVKQTTKQTHSEQTVQQPKHSDKTEQVKKIADKPVENIETTKSPVQQHIIKEETAQKIVKNDIKATEQTSPVEKNEPTQTTRTTSVAPQITTEPTQTTVPYAPPKQKKQSAFDKYVQTQNTQLADNEQKWTAENASPKQSEDAVDEQTQNDLDSIKAIDAIKATAHPQEEQTLTQAGDEDGQIKWSGSARRLKSAGGIVAPEEISLIGLKTSIVLKFEVFPNGLIGAVDVLESTGETSWDNDIVEQFKTNYKFDSSDKHATGIIQIQIGL